MTASFQARDLQPGDRIQMGSWHAVVLTVTEPRPDTGEVLITTTKGDQVLPGSKLVNTTRTPS